MKILYTSPIIKYPPIGGPYLRVENSIKALSKISELILFSREDPVNMGGKEAINFYQNYCKKIYFLPPKISTFIKLKSFIKKSINYIFRRFFLKNIPNISFKDLFEFYFLIDIAKENKITTVWMGYGNISYILLRLIKENTKYRVICDTDSVWSRATIRGIKFIQDESVRKEIFDSYKNKVVEEKWGTNLSDITTAVSEVDMKYYKGISKKPEKIKLFSNVIDVNNYKKPLPAKKFEKPFIYLAGYFGKNSPMDDAARWMIFDIFPLVRKEIIDLDLYIIGNNSDETLKDINNPDIKITGKLESVLPYLYYANVCVVPLRFESGTRFKILEAGICGIPVVSTTLGAEGLLIENNKDILIADNPNEFAEAIIKLIRNMDLSRKISENLRKVIIQKYSIESLKSEGEKILEYLSKLNKAELK